MPVLTAALQADGALVEVLIGLSAAAIRVRRAALQPIPPAVNARALLDTGAEATCVDPALVQSLALPWSGVVLANLPATGGLTFGNRYEVGLTVVHPSGKGRLNLVRRDQLVLELPLAPLGYQVLIGRDVLASCRFLYDGPANRFRLAY